MTLACVGAFPLTLSTFVPASLLVRALNWSVIVSGCASGSVTVCRLHELGRIVGST
jgi:hypothetical protein